MNKQNLNQIKKIYDQGGNIIQFLKKGNSSQANSDEMVLISYDFQSGSYIKYVQSNPKEKDLYTKSIAAVINNLNVKYDSILEAGVGEATTLASLLPKLKAKPKDTYGFDISWSRIKYGQEYLKKKRLSKVFLFVGDLFNIPIADNAIDIVYTSHSIEPNGGKEKEALKELYRITNKYLILLEPAYELADKKARERMEHHGYIKNLYSTAKSLKYNVLDYKLFDYYINPLNPTGLMIIKKSLQNKLTNSKPLLCPISKTPLSFIRGSYFSKKGLLAYPIIDKVPCLLNENAVIATHYLDRFTK
ncbi:methyltransferase domain-containing protein [Candidatus Beckwithbacteria bacterium]|nr:methyltransferase domain-containing protein [Candidatus Beckwithbacteria bacterium]